VAGLLTRHESVAQNENEVVGRETHHPGAFTDGD
jgi:hypothetical protein